MDIKVKKINKNMAVGLFLWTLFFFVVLYELYTLYNLYNVLNAANNFTTPKTSRFDFTSYNKALGFYNASGNLILVNTPDPFATASPPPAPKK